MAKELVMSELDVNLIVFRLDELEKKIAENFKALYGKLESMTDIQANLITRLALESQQREQLEKRICALEDKQSKLDEKVVKVQVTLAEKLGYGALGGGIVAVIAQVINIVVHSMGGA